MLYAAQTNVLIDAELVKKGCFRAETISAPNCRLTFPDTTLFAPACAMNQQKYFALHQLYLESD